MVVDVVIWWLVAALLGLAGLPLTSWLFQSLPDGGYPFARTLGLLLTGYVAWMLAMFGLGDFGPPLLIIGILVTLSLGLWAGGGPQHILAAARAAWPRRRLMIVAYEALFLAAFLFVVWMRGHDPVPWGTERPMDFAFFNAIQNSPTFPPNDPWLAGYSINYYYFGYLLMAAVSQLSGVMPNVAYNLALALLFALTAVGVAGMIANLMLLTAHTERRVRNAEPRTQNRDPDEQLASTPHASDALIARSAGHPVTRSRSALLLFPLLGVILVLVAGNQSGAIQVVVGDERAVVLDGPQLVSALVQAAQGNQQITLPYPNTNQEFGAMDTWERRDRWNDFNWWWPSRSLWDKYPDPSGGPPREPHTITEFPFFSFRLGDMHPHVMALPFGLLALALALSTLTRPNPPDFSANRSGLLELFLVGLIIGGLYVINSWDLPTYLLLYAAVLVFLHLRQAGAGTLAWGALLRNLALVLVAAIVVFVPFQLTFRSLVGSAAPLVDLPILSRITSVIGVYLGERSGLHELLVIFGLFVLPIVGFVYALAAGSRSTVLGSQFSVPGSQFSVPGSQFSVFGSQYRVLFLLPPLLLLIGLLIGFPLLALAGLGLLAVFAANDLRERPAASFALLVVALGCAVIVGTEMIYIRDVFEGWSSRFNTIFKFYYQIWLLWGMLAPFALWWALTHVRGGARIAVWIVTGLSMLFLAGALIYPGIVLRDLSRGEWIGLDGRTPREQSAAGRNAIEWLRMNAAPGSVILEAADLLNPDEVALGGIMPRCGGSYNGAGYGGVSAATGLPTLIGWSGHQDQWRGGDPEARAELQPRCEAVDTIYRTTDQGRAQALLDQYAVRYVYVGSLERNLYGPESLAKFDNLGERAFYQDEVTIYRLP
ncbi:MAG: hypothetical protein HC822_09775 [Oscillochloris sp.]|nr:hypothetical protein [Oscillochloris sp.]